MSAVYASILEGTQPRLRQVPPNRSRSTIATRKPGSPSRGSMFPEPAPTITRSYSIIAGGYEPRPVGGHRVGQCRKPLEEVTTRRGDARKLKQTECRRERLTGSTTQR